MRMGHRFFKLLMQFALCLPINAASVFAEDPPSAVIAAWVKGLMKEGRLTVEFYDRNKPPHPYPGWTEFDFRLEYRYDYLIELPRKKGDRRVVLQPQFTKIEVPIKHRMQLPNYLDSELWYDAPLARHELEHVCVGMHPRLAMLGSHLVKRIVRIETNLDPPDEANADWISKKVDAAIVPRRDAIKTLIQDINRKIDELTDHGDEALPDRNEFLSTLFLKENLDEMKFPYLSEVLDLISTREYQRAQLVIRDDGLPPRVPPK
ncbi:MAG: hypothetical protein JSS49_26905 [Planctomycetes bacterium]|nr:hypothetical protein [Planctomycetota bacterium]